ncbi:leishmanolysin-related zinc metalloendopeptidase [Algoriphagus antarcticus]|uniref:Leishmanolysin n=1 Tax=Algoriphagus antarcticus TaxID=238540 RepID=A0A3E0DLW7_9BACT|nr:leishmanolysin-related zinc metalloendopeptidase [Algoriphagus antarcticus]REG82777.1 leishmanolysin [Algoriphagus antarcticus]
MKLLYLKKIGSLLPTVQKQTFGRIASVLLVSTIVFTSCSELSEEQPILPDQSSQLNKLNLVEPQGELITIRASGEDYSSNAKKKSGFDNGRFNITLKFLTPISDRQRMVFVEAAERWEKIIVKDVPSVTFDEFPLPSAFGGPPVADIGETIDDLIIEVVLQPIDGPGQILGGASPNFVRNIDFLTLSGFMIFDTADLDDLDQLGLFDEVIVHEMGHVLGVGTLWDFQRTLLDFNSQGFPFFNGTIANRFWKNEGGTAFLPIEFRGGPGTAFSHWDELILDNELMTGFINLGYNPLSRITAASLRDLGYGTSMAAEKYDLPRGTAGVENSRKTESGGIDIEKGEVLSGPVGIVVIDSK